MGNRLVHKATDGLSAEALRVMTSGFRAKKTYRAIALDLADIGSKVPERTIARRGHEWQAEQSRRQGAREQVQDLVAAMKSENLSAAEMLQALAVEELMRDPAAWSGKDPLRVQSQGLQAEKLRIEREAMETRKREVAMAERRLDLVEARERRAAAVLEKPEAELTPEQRLLEIQAIYGIRPQEAHA